MIILFLTLTLLLTISFPSYGSDHERENPVDKLVVLEDLIANAELETAECQTRYGWHFPGELYYYLEVAQQGNENVKKPKNSRLYFQSLQAILSVVNECIEGREGYFSGNRKDVWVNPVPSIPECAKQVFEELKVELENELGVKYQVENLF